MKKIVTLSLAGALAASLLAPSAQANLAKPKQEVTGTIVAPAPFTDDTGCFAGLHRRGAILTQENNNGAIGWHFDVDPKTAGKKFVLDVAGQGSYVDVDVTFYQEFGTVDDVAGDPANAGAPASLSFATRAAGGEKGKVPKGYPKAIVCMYGGAQGSGVLGAFTYTAG
jgi:hypothetical protein